MEWRGDRDRDKAAACRHLGPQQPIQLAIDPRQLPRIFTLRGRAADPRHGRRPIGLTGGTRPIGSSFGVGLARTCGAPARTSAAVRWALEPAPGLRVLDLRARNRQADRHAGRQFRRGRARSAHAQPAPRRATGCSCPARWRRRPRPEAFNRRRSRRQCDCTGSTCA